MRPGKGLRLPSERDYFGGNNLIRIFLADDHEVARSGIRRILCERQGWQICGEAGNGSDALQLVKQLEPDVAILDVSMPEMNGLQVTREIKRQCPHVEVLIYSVQESEESIRRSIEAGALGYVLKAEAGKSLVEAVEALSHHRPYFTTRATDLRRFLHSSTQTPIPPLTRRECEIIQILAEGKGNKEIAVMLCISAKTVETHRAIIKRKLGISSIVDLVHYAVRNELVPPWAQPLE